METKTIVIIVVLILILLSSQLFGFVWTIGKSLVLLLIILFVIYKICPDLYNKVIEFLDIRKIKFDKISNSVDILYDKATNYANNNYKRNRKKVKINNITMS